MSTLLEQAELAADLLGAAAHENGRIVCTAESLTGGMVSGYVTYQISGKEEMIDVPAEVIAEFGVVSEPVAEAMARGALACSHADLSVALTGVAGPSGGTAQTPVGTVCIGWAERDPSGAIATSVRTIHVTGDRRTVRLAASLTALQGLIALIRGGDPMRMPSPFD